MCRRMFLLACATALCPLVVVPVRAQNADVIHWWTSGGESKAVAVFAEEYKKRGGAWIDSAVVGGPAARAAATNRIAGGNPPTAMQWNTAIALRQLDDQGVLAHLDDLAAQGDWKAALPPLIYDAISHKGHVIAAPLNIQNISLMFYNTKLLRDLGIEPPKTWDEFFPAADRIKQAGLIPLAQAGQPAFINILWQSVLLGAGGPDVYRKVYVQHDAKAAGGPEMVRAFETFRRLTGYIDPGANNRKWNDTALLIQNGKAAMFINGDWAKGEFNAAGQTAGREFECAPVPGTRGHQIVIVDTFAFPKGNRPDADAARHTLVGVLMDPAVQVAFNTAKGALPARVDARMGPLDSCGRLGEEVVRTDPGKLLPGSNLAFPPDTDGQTQDLIGQFWSRPGMTAQQAARELSRIVADVDR